MKPSTLVYILVVFICTYAGFWFGKSQNADEDFPDSALKTTSETNFEDHSPIKDMNSETNPKRYC